MKFPRKAEAVNTSGQDKFLKIKDNESVTGVFRGEIHEYFMKWVEGKSVPCQMGEPGAKIRFELNFVTFKDGRFKAFVWSFPQTVYNMLASVNEEYPLQTTKVKISRKGTGTDTEYHILPLLKEPLAGQTLHQIEATELNILDKPKAHNEAVPPDNIPWPEGDEAEIPF